MVFTDPEGKEHRMPAFWAGEQTWKVRFAAGSVGKYSFRTISSDAAIPISTIVGERSWSRNIREITLS